MAIFDDHVFAHIYIRRAHEIEHWLRLSKHVCKHYEYCVQKMKSTTHQLIILPAPRPFYQFEVCHVPEICIKLFRYLKYFLNHRIKYIQRTNSDPYYACTVNKSKYSTKISLCYFQVWHSPFRPCGALLYSTKWRLKTRNKHDFPSQVLTASQVYFRESNFLLT